MKNECFRKLSSKEEEEFRQWARDCYVVNTPVSEAWHPAARAECELMNLRHTREVGGA
jgi:hypothetical protein